MRVFPIKVLNATETKTLLQMGDVVDVVRQVYEMKARQATEVFPLVFHEFNPGVADMDIRSGWLKTGGVFGLKLVSWFGDNPKKGLPALIGTVLVCDDATGAPIGLLDGAHITGMRTGAAGAIGAKLLARPNSKTLLLVGAGHVATFLAAATLQLFPGLETVRVYDGLSFENARAFAGGLPAALKGELGMDVPAGVAFEAVEDVAAAAGQSDIIMTVTPSKEPIIQKAWVRPGTHFSCIGADMAGKQEIDGHILQGARIFVDDVAQNMNVGEVEVPIKQGLITEKDIAGEIGEVITGAKPGRQSDEEITVFDATGTALLDLLTAKLCLDEATKQDMGVTVEI